jgi:F-type H+-transporting ATPase subunit alpha
LTRGARMVEILKQGQYSPIPVEKQIAIIFAGTNGMLDDLPLDQIKAFEQELYRFLENAHPAILTTIKEKKTIDDDLKGKLNSALQEFKSRFVQDQTHKAAAARK